MGRKFTIINPKDNVAVALQELRKDEVLDLESGGKLKILENIPACHKIALEDIPLGKTIYKYGEEIGRAANAIKKGEWIHSHNLQSVKMAGKEYEA